MITKIECVDDDNDDDDDEKSFIFLIKSNLAFCFRFASSIF